MKIDFAKLKQELHAYYFSHTLKQWNDEKPMAPLYRKFEAAAEPGISAIELKTRMFEIMADWFVPVIFPHSPFFSEMGLKPAESYGTHSAGKWIVGRNYHLLNEVDPQLAREVFEAKADAYHECGSFPDLDHHVFPCGNVIQNGLEFYYSKALTLSEQFTEPKQKEFCHCCARALLAVRKIARKFAEAAKSMLASASDDASIECLRLMAESGDIPWRPCHTFHEGLLTLWFTYEVMGSTEGLALGVLGRPDFLLIDLYRNDIASGRITKESAADLIGAFMLYLDNKEDFSKNMNDMFIFAERCGSLVLGGCDAHGNPVYNELTELFLTVHRDMKLVYPKLQVRFCSNTPKVQFDLINQELLAGRCTMGIVNDSAVVKAQVKAGKRLEDARDYVTGGCWEVTCEGNEHSAGAMCYYSLAKAMNLSVLPDPDSEKRTGEHFVDACQAQDFDSFWQIVMDNTIRSVRKMCYAIGKCGSKTDQVVPAPFFSACLNDCLDNGKDYNAGGGRYNPHGVPFCGLATFMNSMLAVKHLCFERKLVSLKELQNALRADWKGFEYLQAAAKNVPMFLGDGLKSTCDLTQKTLDQLSACLNDLRTERGGRFQPALYSYNWGILGQYTKKIGPTPDGRSFGAYVSQGLAPSHLHSADALTTMINTCRMLDLSEFSAGSVLTVSVSKNKLTSDILFGLEKAFLETGVEMLQLNCLNRAELDDAVIHPEQHQDLIVRLYGYSARFVKLAPEQQKEFIERNIY